MRRKAILVDADKLRIITWMNGREYFWMQEIKEHFGCRHYEDHSAIKGVLDLVIKILKNKGVIQCWRIEGSKRQYYRFRIITMEDLDNG